MEDELISKYKNKLPRSDLFKQITRKDQIEKAYRLRGKDIAFSLAEQKEKMKAKEIEYSVHSASPAYRTCNRSQLYPPSTVAYTAT